MIRYHPIIIWKSIKGVETYFINQNVRNLPWFLRFQEKNWSYKRDSILITFMEKSYLLLGIFLCFSFTLNLIFGGVTFLNIFLNFRSFSTFL